MAASPPAGALVGAAREYDARVAAVIADDEDLMDYVTRLESMLDDDEGDSDGDSDEVAELDVDDADALVEEVERFLRERDS